MPTVNDVHSQLNATRVTGIARPWSLESLRDAVECARRQQKPISIAGGRHAMGTQQFGADTILADARDLKLRYDPDERFQSDWYRHYRAMFGGSPVVLRDQLMEANHVT